MSRIFFLLTVSLFAFGCKKSSPAKEEDITVYFCTDKLYAIDGKTGISKWVFTMDVTGEDAATPAYGNSTIYIGGYNWMYAVDAITGLNKWGIKMDGRDMLGSPVVGNGVVYAPGYKIGTDQKIFAWDENTGQEKWSYLTELSANSPTLVDNKLYISSNVKIYAFDAVLGTKQWTFQPDNLVVSSSNPAVANGFIYFGCYDKKIYALYVVSGAKKWDYLTTDSVKSSPVVSNGLLYIASGGKLLCLDAISGVKKWDASIGSSISAPGSPVVANNMVYVGGSVKIMAFDAATGDKKWDFTTGGSKSSVVVAGNTLYMGAKNKKLYALDAITGEKKWELLTNNAIDSSPIVVIGSKAYYPSVSGMVQ